MTVLHPKVENGLVSTVICFAEGRNVYVMLNINGKIKQKEMKKEERSRVREGRARKESLQIQNKCLGVD